MTIPNVHEFHLPDTGSVEDLLLRMKGVPWKIICEPERKVDRTYFDTFDWRLHDVGYSLAGEASDLPDVTVLYRLVTGERVLHAQCSPGTFAGDFPPGPLRALLEETSGIRALLPVAEVRLETAPCALVDRRGKTLVHLSLVKGAAARPGEAPGQSLLPRLRVEGVRGYGPTLRQVLIELDRHGFKEIGKAPFEEILDILSHTPGGYRPKPVLRLEPEASAGRAMRAILRHLLEVMEVNLPGTVDNLDSEFLHDFRVAVRRTRSALAQVKKVFPPGEIQPFRDRFKWLGSVTGPTRDLDVYLLKFPTYRTSLPETTRGDLDPFLRFLQEHHRREQKKLARILASNKVSSLLREWRAYLETEPDEEPAADHAAMPVHEVARRRIGKLYRRFVKEGRAIGAASPDESIHQLRITGKKLRYLLEFFSSLFPEEKVTGLIKGTKALQDFLGDFNDLTVQQEKIQEFGRQMQAEGDVPAATLVAMGRLVEDMARRQKDMRHEFRDRFAAFDRGRLRGLFEELFRAEKTGEP